MIPVSEAYKQSILAPNRQVLAKVIADYTDPTRDESISVAASEEANVSWRMQVADSLTAPAAPWASLDGSWVLDGTYRLAPHDQESADLLQMGWWGSQLAGAGGAFVQPYPTLALTFSPRNVSRLQVVGDSARGEYPVDFEIRLYDPTDALLHTETVAGNAQVAWSKTLPNPVVNVARLELTITRWSHPGRQAKVLELFSMIQETYDGSRIRTFALVEERETDTGSLPVGNIASAQMTLVLDNTDRRFDPGNLGSPLFGWVRQGVRFRPYLGVRLPDNTVEWIPMGVFWAIDWQVEEGGGQAAYARVVARDILDRLRRTDYRSATVMQNATLAQVAEATLADAGLEPGAYIIDPSLAGVTVAYAWLGPTSHREALRQVAEAGLAQCYADRQGRIRLATDPSQATLQPAAYWLQGAPYPAEIAGIPDAYGIGPSSYYRKSHPSGRMANEVVVGVQPWQPSAAPEEVYRSKDPVAVPAGGSVTILAEYAKAPVIGAAASLENPPPGMSITAAQYRSWYAEVTISNSGGTPAQAVLVITGTVLEVRGSERRRAADEASIRLHGRYAYELSGNALIQDGARAQAIADSLLAAYSQPRRDVEVEWRGDPALELGDVITLPESRDGTARGYYVVTRQEFRWAGALRAVTSGRRIAVG